MLQNVLGMKKCRSNSVRTYDNEGYAQRAGCICFKTDQENEVVLVSSSRVPGRWVVPAGGVEPGERSENAATREVEEEAGVRGKIGRFLGIFTNDTNKTRTAVYVLIVTEELETWEESKNGRRRQWFTVDNAIDLLSCRPIQQKYLSEAINSRISKGDDAAQKGTLI